jgi:hypothetical protein
VKLRTKLAVFISLPVLLLGLNGGTPASAGDTNGCVVLTQPLAIAACLGRL